MTLEERGGGERWCVCVCVCAHAHACMHGVHISKLGTNKEGSFLLHFRIASVSIQPCREHSGASDNGH